MSSNQVNGYVAVAKLLSAYLIAHINGTRTLFPEQTIPADLQTAIVAARSFAEREHLPFHGLISTRDPIFTVIEIRGYYFPAMINSFTGSLIRYEDQPPIGGSQSWAEGVAQLLAEVRHASFMSYKGMTLPSSTQ